jgi:hypothetical protein
MVAPMSPPEMANDMTIFGPAAMAWPEDTDSFNA